MRTPLLQLSAGQRFAAISSSAWRSRCPKRLALSRGRHTPCNNLVTPFMLVVVCSKECLERRGAGASAQNGSGFRRRMAPEIGLLLAASRARQLGIEDVDRSRLAYPSVSWADGRIRPPRGAALSRLGLLGKSGTSARGAFCAATDLAVSDVRCQKVAAAEKQSRTRSVESRHFQLSFSFRGLDAPGGSR